MIWKLLLPLLFCLNLYGQSDKYLIIKHRSKSKEVVVQEGQFVMVKTFKGEKVRGSLLVMSETVIKVKHKLVPLTSVESIAIRNNTMMKIGSAAVSMGMNLLFYALQSSVRSGWKTLDENYTVSVPFLTAGISLMWLSNQRTSKHWTYHGQMPGW